MNQGQSSRTESSARGASSESTSAANRNAGMSDRSGSACRGEAEAQGLVDGWNFRLLV